MSSPIEPLVLLVDDEPSLLALLTDGLTHAGFRVVATQTAADALQRATKLGRIDILATDIVLPESRELTREPLQQPEMHGLALMRRLQTLQPELKVLLFSGQSREMINSFGGIPKGTAFLRKPFAADTLIQAIRELLERTARKR
jgi:two-component system cell cycle sensor histidine kinase/response regulator CckA